MMKTFIFQSNFSMIKNFDWLHYLNYATIYFCQNLYVMHLSCFHMQVINWYWIAGVNHKQSYFCFWKYLWYFNSIWEIEWDQYDLNNTYFAFH